MAQVSLSGMTVRGIVGCVPEKEVSNEKDYPWFEASEIRKSHGHGGDQVAPDGR